MSGQLIGRGYITIAGLKDGDPAKTYVLIPSVENVTKKLDGTMSANTVNCSVYKVTGSSAYALSGDHTVTYVRKPDGASGTLAHPSGTTGNVNILADTESVEFELKDGGTVIDRVRVPVLSDATDVNNELDTYKYLKDSLAKQGTTIKDGLILTSLMAMGYTDAGNVRHTLAGMNGIYVPSLGGRTPAAWYGGHMIDRFGTDGKPLSPVPADAATSLIRMDGSFYFANGNIGGNTDGSAWLGGQTGFRIDAQGNVTMGNGVTINLADGSEKGIVETLQSLTNFNIGVTRLLAPCDAQGNELPGGWQEAFQHDGSGDPEAIKAKSLKAKVGFWSEGFISCLGLNAEGGGTGGSGSSGGSAYGLVRTWQEAAAEGSDTNSALGANLGYSLYSALTSHTADTTAHITAAERTKWNKVVADFSAITGADSDSIINKWEEVVNFLATYTEADTLANLLGNKADKTTTISAGTGLTGGGSLAANRTLSLAVSGVTAGTYFKTTVDTYGRVTSGSNPTTLSGFGITDAYTKSQADGKYVNLTGTQTITGVKTFSNGFKAHYGGGSYISMATRPNQILGDMQTSAASAHSLFMLKNSTGAAIAYGGLGQNIGFYGFYKSRIDAGTNGTDWRTIWNVDDGSLLHTGIFEAATIRKTGGTSSQFLKADGSVDGTAYLPKATFDSMFELVTENGVTSIRAKYGLWTNEFLSCKGMDASAGSGGTSGGGSAYGLYTDSTWASAALSTDALGAQLGKALHHRLQSIENLTLVTVGGDGASEMGRYIDFHTVPKGAEDYIARIDAGTSGNALREFYLPTDAGTFATQEWVTGKNYLTAHQSLANYVTLNTEQTITAKKTINILGLGEVSDDWNIPVRSNRLQWLLSSGTQAANAPGTYYSGVSFMTGYVGFQLAVYGSKSNERLYFRKVSDNGTWSGWHGIIHTGTTDMLDTRYYTKTEINTKLTDGSVTKVGTASVGNSSRPVYLNAGVPTAGLYAFGINNGNAAIFVSFPTYTTLINGGYLRSDYESAGHPNSDFFKALLCWAGATYPSGGTLIGKAIPNAQGTCIINLYNGAVDPDTKLPRYGSGIFITAQSDVQPFRVYSYDYTYSGRFQGLSDTATKLATARRLWGRTFDGTADVSGDMTSVGSIAASGQIKTTSANAFRAIHGNYGFIIRNDGGSTYFLLTDSGDAEGSYNSFRPFYIDNTTGKAHMNNGVAINGGLTVGGGITTNKLSINAGGSSAYLTADTTTNAFMNVNGKSLMTWDGGNTAVRPGSSLAGQVSLGTSSIRWSNVYATAINVSSNALVGNLNADMVDGVHAADIDHSRRLFTKNDYEHYVVLLWKVDQNDWHRISGRLYTSCHGASRYNAADIDLWYSRWGTGNSFDKFFRLDTYGSASPNSWKLVTCTYNGESWYALQYKSTQAISAFFIGTFNSIAFTAVKYYTSYPSTVNNSEINSSIADKTGELSKTHVGTVPYALTSDNVASATRLQTARTLWGQSFNGGANVSGNMTGVGSVASSYGIAHNITDINTSVGTNAYWYGLGLHLSGQNNFVTLGGYFGLKLFSANGMLSMLDNGNVGIGTASPMYRLHVCGRTVIDNVDDYYALWLNKGGVCCDGGSGDVWNNGYGALNVGCYDNSNQTPLVVAYRNGSAAAHTGASRLFAMELLNSGRQLNFGFGGTALMSMFSDGTFYAKTGIWSDGYMSCKGNDTTSDVRLKDILGEFRVDVRAIAAAPSVRFAWKDGSGEDVGSTAQYWQEVSPHLVHRRADGMLGLQYGKAALNSVIAVARKTLDIEERVKELERENTGLRDRIAALEGRQINH